MKFHRLMSGRRLRVRRRAIETSVILATASLFMAACSKEGSDSGDAIVTLKVFTCQECMPFDWQVAAFEKSHPNIRVDVQSVPFGQFYAKTAVLAASSNPPDIYAVDQPTIANLASKGVIMPLDDYLGADYIASLTKVARADFTYEGKIYSPGPIDTSLALFYNETYLSEIGIKPPATLDTAWTWPEAMKAMQACQNSASVSGRKVWGLAPSTIGNGTPGFDYHSSLFLRSMGRKDGAGKPTFQAISADGKTVDGYINSPDAIEAAKFYQDMFQGVRITPTAGIPNAFIDGKACFDLNVSANIVALAEAKVPFKWGVTPLPYFNTPIVHSGTMNIAVGTKTTHQIESIEFIKFISSPEQQIELLKKVGTLPVIESLYKSDPTLSSIPWKIFVDELNEWGEPRPITPHYLQYSHVVSDAMRDIAYGVPVKERLDQAVRELDPMLTR